MSELTVTDIERSAKVFENPYREYRPPYFITKGTGVPDDAAIDFFKDSDVIVVTRNGNEYQYGKRRADNDEKSGNPIT